MEESSVILEFFSLFQGGFFLSFWRFIFLTAPFWLPIVLVFTFAWLWLKWRRKEFILSQDYVLLEVKLAADIAHTPRAMENVFAGIHITAGENTWYDRYIKGKVRPWYSFELVSIGGEIHFYIWTRVATKDIVEAQIYAQYPEVEIVEAPGDYARNVQYVPGRTGLWGANFELSKPDPYPIKTYVDYGLDREGTDEEEKVDPIASVFEYLSSLKSGEQAWIQIVMQATKNQDRKKPGGRFWEKEGWKHEAERLVKELREETLISISRETDAKVANPTTGQKDVINAIERSTGKHGFECGIRAIYWAEGDAFKGTNIPGLIATMKHFSSNNLNSISIDNVTDFNYPWQDYKKIREDRNCRRFLEAYRKRSWFYPPYKRKAFVLNTEELATIYHFPGRVVQAPGLPRIDSKRGGAPTNLPV